MQSISLFTPFVLPQPLSLAVKFPLALPQPLVRDSFQRFSGLSSAESKKAQWEETQNPSYINAKNWAKNRFYGNEDSRIRFLNEGGKGFTDYAIAAMLDFEEASNTLNQPTSPDETIVDSPEHTEGSIYGDEVNSPAHTIEVSFSKARASASLSGSVDSVLTASNYKPFDVNNPRQRALPEARLDQLSRDLRVACAKYENDNDLVSKSVESSGQKVQRFSKRQNIGYRWKVSNADL